MPTHPQHEPFRLTVRKVELSCGRIANWPGSYVFRAQGLPCDCCENREEAP